MGRGPGTGANLQSELTAQRDAAEAALEFFRRVAPLAQRLGMTDFPEFSVFQSRLRQTDDLNTARLRADGVVVQQLHTTLVSQVDVQTRQDEELVTHWPDGSGTAAQQRLRALLAGAEADLAAIGAIGSGMMVAADCIDVARYTQYCAVAGIDPDNLLAVPISLWLKMQTACFAHHAELKAAIEATVGLFGTAVSTCDEAIDSILAGLCAAMAEVDVADCSAAGSGPSGQLGPADGRVVARDTDGPPPGGIEVAQQPLGQSGAGGLGSGSPMPDGNPGATGTASVGTASVGMASAGVAGAAGTSSAVGTPALTTGAIDLLGSLMGAVGTIAAAAVTGLAETIITVVSQIGLSSGGTVDTGSEGEPSRTLVNRGSADTTASITVGDKTIEISGGPNGTSVSLTVTGADGTTDTHVLEVRADGSIGEPGETATAGPVSASAVPTDPAASIDPAPASPVGSTPQPAPEAVLTAPTEGQAQCPPVDSGPPAPVPQVGPQAAVPPAPTATHTTPGVSSTPPNPGTPVSPQSSQEGDGASPQDDGQVALAGDQ